jgi:hypothetical protein
MYRLNGKNGLFGLKYVDSDRALEAKQITLKSIRLIGQGLCREISMIVG